MAIGRLVVPTESASSAAGRPGDQACRARCRAPWRRRSRASASGRGRTGGGVRHRSCVVFQRAGSGGGPAAGERQGGVEQRGAGAGAAAAAILDQEGDELRGCRPVPRRRRLGGSRGGTGPARPGSGSPDGWTWCWPGCRPGGRSRRRAAPPGRAAATGGRPAAWCPGRGRRRPRRRRSHPCFETTGSMDRHKTARRGGAPAACVRTWTRHRCSAVFPGQGPASGRARPDATALQRFAFRRERGTAVARCFQSRVSRPGARPPAICPRLAPCPRRRPVSSGRYVAAIVAAQVLAQIGAFTLPALLPGYIDALVADRDRGRLADRRLLRRLCASPCRCWSR